MRGDIMSENQWKCPKCSTLNQSKFCIACGTPKPVEVNKEANGWFCMNCGQKNYGKFCTKCGRPQGKNSVLRQQNQQQMTIIPPVKTQTSVKQTEKILPASQLNNNSTGQSVIDKNKLVKIVVAAVVIIALAGGGYYYYTTQQPVSSEKTMTQEEAKPAEDESTAVKEMKTDLSLGGLDIGDTKDDIKQVEKNLENDMKQEGTLTRYYYDDMQIVIEDNKIVALISNNDSVETKKGLHQGSTFADVKKAYGIDYQQFDAGNGITCYEYSFKSQDGRDGLLRFAVKDSDHKVDYISVRIPDEAMAKAASAQSASNTSAGNTGTARNNSARKALLDFHQAISSHDFNTAWNYLTPEQQQRMGGFSSFQNGYADTISSDISNVGVQSASDNQVILSYDITARDHANNGVKVQNFTGSATLVSVNGQWKISYTESKKTGEHME